MQDKRQYEVLGMPGLISALINKNRKLRHDSHPSNKKVAGGLPPALGGSLFSHQSIYAIDFIDAQRLPKDANVRRTALWHEVALGMETIYKSNSLITCFSLIAMSNCQAMYSFQRFSPLAISLFSRKNLIPLSLVAING